MKRIQLSRDYQPILATSYLQDTPPITEIRLRDDTHTWCLENLRDDWTVHFDLLSGRTYIEFENDLEAVLFKTWWL